MRKTLFAFFKATAAFFIWSLFGPVLNLSTFSVNQNIWGVSIIGVVLMTVYALSTKQFGEIKNIRLNRIFLLFLIASGTSGILWLTSLTLLPIGQATFLWSTVPLATLAMAWLFLKERVNFSKIVGLCLGLFGVGVVVSTNFGAFRVNQLLLTGLIYIAIAIVLKSLQAVIIKRFSVNYPVWLTSGLIMASQMVWTTPSALSQPWQVTQFSLIALLVLGFFSALAFFLFVSSFSVLSSSSVMMAGFFEPFLASLWGYLFLKQYLSPWIFLGGILILTSVYFVTRSET